MTGSDRFRDENKLISDFYREVWVVCPACGHRGVCRVLLAEKKARQICTACPYWKELSMNNAVAGQGAIVEMAAHRYFDAELWLQHPFKNDLFYAYNGTHLDYLERYIAASLREHTDRSHFTLLEKLPRFYHEAKNRAPLLKIIGRLKEKG